MTQKKNITVLVVCLGNICRSPVGEFLINHYAAINGKRIKAESAGLDGGYGDMYHLSKKYLQLKKINPRGFQSRSLYRIDLNQFDYILVMENYMKKEVQYSLKKTHRLKSPTILTFKEAAGEKGDIEDPYGMPQKRYFKILDQIDRLSQKIVQRLSHFSPLE